MYPSILTSYINKYSLESTRKRHYYHCRSKQYDTSTSRKRSCAACVRAKTRCTWSADTSLDTCIRCNKRGAKCEYDTAVRRNGILIPGDSDPTSVATTFDGGQDSDIQGSLTTSILTQKLVHPKNVQLSIPTQTYQGTSTAAPFGLLLSGNWDTGLREVNMPGFGDPELLGIQDIEYMKAWGIMSTGASPSVPCSRPLSSPSHFNTRFTKPDHVPLVSLAVRILRSYTSMIVPNGILPPFLSPWLYSSTATSGVPSQQVSCPTFPALRLVSIHWRKRASLPSRISINILDMI